MSECQKCVEEGEKKKLYTIIKLKLKENGYKKKNFIIKQKLWSEKKKIYAFQ